MSTAINFADATAISPKSSHTYAANFHSDWCIGSVPHGGFITACFMRVAATHFSTTLKKQNQPHTITLHLEFLRRTGVGPALFTVRDVKLGRQTSVIHVALSQEVDGDRREEVEGYIINSNLNTESGPSFETQWCLHPSPPPGSPSGFSINKDGIVHDASGNWEQSPPLPFANFRKASNRVYLLFPKVGQKVRASSDQWMALKSGERFTNESLGFICDMFPQLVDALVASDTGSGKVTATFWYPTVLLNLDVKKALPEEGVRWLFLRCRAKTIRNGRYDLEIVILDSAGEVVALSHHVVLVADSKRNLKQRNGRSKDGGDAAKL